MTVPGRIRALRRQKGITVAALASSIGIHKGHLSRIERGEKTPSLATLEAIAKALGAGMAQLFGEKTNEEDVMVVRRAERKKTGDRKTYQLEVLWTGADNTPLAAYVVSPGPQFLEHEVPNHQGKELLFVLQGKIEVQVADKLLLLNPGDCATYDAALHHKLRRKGSALAQVLVVLITV